MIYSKYRYNPHYKEEDLQQTLSVILSDTYLLYIKTHNYHWNITGPNFFSLHTALQTQYEDLAAAADLIAEHIRTLGIRAPGSAREFLQFSDIKENTSEEDWEFMLEDLIQDHKIVLQSLSEGVKISNDLGLEETTHLLADRIGIHKKTIWMLESALN